MDNLKSKAGGVKVSMDFVNKAAVAADLFWVDYEGNLKQYSTIQPGTRYGMGVSGSVLTTRAT